MINITKYSDALHKDTAESTALQIDQIFFESSTRTGFTSEVDKQEFKYKYLDWYKHNFPEFFFIASDANSQIFGYICGTPETRSAGELGHLHPWMVCIREHLESFPAHLHINLAEQARGRGVGSLLLSQFENNLKSQNIYGVHLVTSPAARNVGFYRKNSYTFETKFTWKNVDLLFMGKHLK